MSELEKLHQVHLEITDEIHRICTKHNLKYSLIAGSLLGAVRHQGFIPWDDDLDLGMLRQDYDQFMKIIENELQDNFYYMSLDNHGQYATPFVKIMKKNTIIEEGNLPKNMQGYGIFVDLFPFDNVPKNKSNKFFHKTSTEILKKLLLAKSNYVLELSKINSSVYKVLKVISRVFTRSFLVEKLNGWVTRYNYEDSTYVTNVGGSYGYTKETIKKEWFESLIKYDFDGHEYWGFKNYNDYLSSLYGDYMKLPEISERENRHNYGYIDFDTSKRK